MRIIFLQWPLVIKESNAPPLYQTSTLKAKGRRRKTTDQQLG